MAVLSCLGTITEEKDMSGVLYRIMASRQCFQYLLRHEKFESV